MPFAVACFCSYFCNRSLMWRGEDFDSFKWIKALKGEEIRGYATVPVNGTWRRLTNANVDSAVDWFASIAAEHLRKRKIKGPFVIIPVPNSKCVVSSTVKPQTRKLAKALCDVLGDGSSVADCLRWKKNLGSASKEGGPREPEILYNNAVLLADALKGVDHSQLVILVDDVTTSGGHLRACAAKLRSKQLKVKIALCGGKTTYGQDNPAFHLYEDELEDYGP